MTGKTVVVTGATPGSATRRRPRSAAAGARVLVTARSRQGPGGPGRAGDAHRRFEPVAVGRVRPGDLASVRHGAEEILELAPRLDVLINNAGLVLT